MKTIEKKDEVAPNNKQIVVPLFSSPLYKETTKFRFNQAELKIIHSMPYHPVGVTPPFKSVDVSKDHEIFKQKKFKRIKNFIDERTQYFFKKILFIKNELAITQSWITKGRPGSAHHKHRHPNALFSLVYYVDCPSTQLRLSREDNFMDDCSLFSYKFEQYNIYNSRHWTVPVTTGDLLIFPASVFHESSPNVQTTDKWVLSCNYFLKNIPKEI
jgi:uncharacterized protein (TIGR02466 family)